MEILNKLFLLLLLPLKTKLQFAIPKSPCPNIFTYKYEQSEWYGEIKFIIYPQPNYALINIEYSSSIQLTDSDGTLELSNELDVADDIGKNVALQFIYKFTFPIQKVLPIIRSIMFNGLLYCRGEDDPRKRTIISLQHSTRWANKSEQNNLPSPGVKNRVQSPGVKDSIQSPGVKNRIQEHKINSDLSDICGTVPLSVIQLVYRGEPAGVQPWLVSLYDNKYTFFCGGSVISNKHVLTAAHCVHGQKSILMKLGGKNIYFNETSSNVKYRFPKNIHKNPDYTVGFSHGDIAIIELNEPITFSEQIRPLCLWEWETDINKIVGQIGNGVGWGLNEDGILNGDELRKTNLRIVSQQDCLKQKVTQTLVTDKTFCARGERSDSGPCKGDSGGPFTMEFSSKSYIRGIISSTIGVNNYCDLNYYSVYADVAKYNDWILSIIN